MGRALRIIERAALLGDRSQALAHFRVTRSAARAASVNYWVFEDVARPGHWVEFVEARDGETLRRALDALDLAEGDASILNEVELD
ncbi:MAG: hypothetical protein U0132_21120 [Gemmatimonadaceae bacterium]